MCRRRIITAETFEAVWSAADIPYSISFRCASLLCFVCVCSLVENSPCPSPDLTAHPPPDRLSIWRKPLRTLAVPSIGPHFRWSTTTTTTTTVRRMKVRKCFCKWLNCCGWRMRFESYLFIANAITHTTTHVQTYHVRPVSVEGSTFITTARACAFFVRFVLYRKCANSRRSWRIWALALQPPRRRAPPGRCRRTRRKPARRCSICSVCATC